MKLETYPNCFKKSTIMKWKCGGCSWYIRCWYDTNEAEEEYRYWHRIP